MAERQLGARGYARTLGWGALALLLVAAGCAGDRGGGEEAETTSTTERETTTTERETTTTTEAPAADGAVYVGCDPLTYLDLAAGWEVAPIEVFTDQISVISPAEGAGFEGDGECPSQQKGTLDLVPPVSPSGAFYSGAIRDTSDERVGYLDVLENTAYDVQGDVFEEDSNFVVEVNANTIGFNFQNELIIADFETGQAFAYDPETGGVDEVVSPTAAPILDNAEGEFDGLSSSPGVENGIGLTGLDIEYNRALVSPVVDGSDNLWPRGPFAISPNGDFGIYEESYVHEPGDTFAVQPDGGPALPDQVLRSTYESDVPELTSTGYWVSDYRYVYGFSPAAGDDSDNVIAVDFDPASGNLTEVALVFPESDGFLHSITPDPDGTRIIAHLAGTSPTAESEYWEIDIETLEYQPTTEPPLNGATGYFSALRSMD